MNDYSSNNSLITTDNIFSINRLGLRIIRVGKTATMELIIEERIMIILKKFLK